MRSFYRFLMQFRMLFLRRRAGKQLEEELQFHLEQQMAENRAAGMSEQEARHSAMRAFGNPVVFREQSRASWSWNWLEKLLRDFKISVRTLAKSPGFSLIAVLIIAIGIGATVSLFTIVRSVLLKPLPFREPDRLVKLYGCYHCERGTQSSIASGDYLEWQRQSHGFEQISLWNWSGFNLTGERGELPEFVDAGETSWNLFETLGVQPKLGRAFGEADDRYGASRTVLLTWSFFERRFQGDSAVIGQTLRLNGLPYTIVGVLPESFSYPDATIQLWIPYRVVHSLEHIQNHTFHTFESVARLRSGVSREHAVQELSSIQHQIHMQFGGSDTVEEGVNSVPLMEDVVHEVKTPLYVLLGAVSCLLLITCLNVSNLLVARAATRRKEIAVRAAMGCSRWHLCQSQLIESLVLSTAGGLCGVVLAIFATEWLKANWTGMPRAEAVHIDAVVLVFALGVTLFSSLLAGLLPAITATGTNLLSAMQESGRSLTGGVSRVLLRRGLLMVEVALTVVLLVGSGLLFKSFLHLRSLDLGCTTKNVLTMRYSLRGDKYRNPEQIVAFHTQLLERVRHLPGVESAGLALASSVPGEGYYGDAMLSIPEHPPLPEGQHKFALVRGADPEFFRTMEIPLLQGRFFSENEKLDRSKYIIINQSLAREFFPNEDPIGKHIRTDWAGGETEFEIIGIVGDTLFSVKQVQRPRRPMMYFPMLSGKSDTAHATLVIRAARNVRSLALPVQKEIAALDPELPVRRILTMEEIVGKSIGDSSFSASLALAFAALSLVLAAVGLYGVLSYLVTQRTVEIGIRVALGARRDEVMGRMLWDGLRPALLGLLAGIAASFAVGSLIRSLLYGVQPADPTVFVSVCGVLLLVAALACAVPAWRASRLDPMQALRTE